MATSTSPPGQPGAETSVRLRIHVWADPVVDTLGFEPAHPYMEYCWLPVIGPSATWLLRRLAAALETQPSGVEIGAAALAHDLGLGGAGRDSALMRTFERLERFELVRRVDDDTYQVRRRVPPLSARHARRLGAVPAAAHRRMTAPRSAPGPLATAAADYAARGWPVFPLRATAKAPDGRLAPHGLHDATCDARRVALWWAASPNANVGLPTGLAFDVVDVDGAEAKAALEARGNLAPGLVVATGRGWHLYFAASGLPSRAGVLPGVDIRGRGGYVVAPPSLHPSGRAYQVIEAGSGQVLDRVPDGPLPSPPDWLVELCRPPETPTGARTDLPTPRADAYAARALSDECAAVATTPEGARNDRLNRAAFSLGTLVGAGALEETAVTDELLGAARAAGLGETEASRTISSGLTAGLGRPRLITRAPEAPPALGPSPDPERAATEAALARGPSPARSASGTQQPAARSRAPRR